jgi:hypothetical protein
MKNKYLKLLVVALAVAVIVPQITLAAWWNPFSWGWVNKIFRFQKNEQKQEQVICTQDAKLCPDGSYVGRQGPKCEFKPCPKTKDETAGWKTYTNTKYGFEIRLNPNWKEKYYINNANLIKNVANAGETTDYKNANEINIYEQNSGLGISIGIKELPKTTLENISSKISTPTDGSSSLLSKKKILVAGLPAYDEKISFMEISRRTIYFIKDGPEGISYEYMFVLTSDFATPEKLDNSDFEKLLTTFKFTNNQPIVGGDKDSHGCIGSAGYTWCEAKQKCFRAWEEPCGTTKAEIKINIPISLDKIDLSNKHIDATTRDGNKAIRIVVLNNAKFVSTCREQMGDLNGFYNLNKQWDGPVWFINVSGILSDDGTIIFADGINCIGQ